MRIPDLNVTQSVTQRIRDLDLQRFKLDQQISTGQTITHAEDDGSKMSRVIQLDSQKSRLSQYQRNASYATEFLNAGHMNLEKLREINQRAQEIARLAGGGLNGSGIETYSLELDQLIDETLNRVNSTHRGKSLFGGQELKPDFAHSDVIVEKAEMKILDLNQSSIGVGSPGGKRYLKQGDEFVFHANGREYVVQAKTPDISEHILSDTYNKGDLVKVTQKIDDSILVDGLEFTSMADILAKLDDKDWSKEKVGELQDGSADIYLLDAKQIEQIAVSLGNQPNLDFFPSTGGYFAAVEREGTFYLEPAENRIENWRPDKNYSSGDLVQWGFEYFRAFSDIEAGKEFTESNWEKVPADSVSEIYTLTSTEEISYWEAALDNIENEIPETISNSWIQINPNDFVSNVSTETATGLIRDLINSDGYFLSESKVYETLDSFAFVRGAKSSTEPHDHDLSLSAKVASNGQLQVRGTVGKSFNASAEYISKYDTNSYYPEQLEDMLVAKGKSLFPGKEYSSLTTEEKDSVWNSVKNEKLHWQINVTQTNTEPTSQIDISLAEPWKRLNIYQLGDVVQHNGQLWESLGNENFNHDPTQISSDFWKDMGSNYSGDREDWNIKSTGTETRFYYSGPDGRLFSDRSDAVNHSFDILFNSTRNYTDQNQLYQDADNLVTKVAYPVSRFEADASNSEGIVYFDATSQSYRLAALVDGQPQIEGSFVKGALNDSSTTDLNRGDVVQYRGSYYLTANVLSPEDVNSVYGSTIIQEADIIGDLTSSVAVGEKIYEESTGRVYMFLGDELPLEGRETVLQEGIEQPMRKGAFVYDPESQAFFVAQENLDDANTVILENENASLIPVNTFSAVQGSEWSADMQYRKGQIVFHNGVYFECQTDGKLDNQGRVVGFDNRDDEELLGSDGDYTFTIVSPSDQFFYESPDAISRESLDLRRARGEAINNNVWLPVTKAVNQVLSFEVNNLDEASVKIELAGPAGVDAQIKVMTDVNGVLSGLQVENPGRYFFPGANDGSGVVSIPESYQIAEIVLPEGNSIRANIIWGENPNDPGPFVITGFELLDTAVLDEPMGAQIGDTYSFATGKKTFLDHRDSSGNLVGVTYTGSDKNAEFYVGQGSKISSFLNAENGGTAELTTVLSSLVDLRNGLANTDIAEMTEVVQLAEKDLIKQEDSVIDKIGSLSSLMVRMNTVRSHDEEYYLEIDQRLSNDLDVDISEAIMQLTRVSTAYQAAMQVGAQLLNTSLLNYL